MATSCPSVSGYSIYSQQPLPVSAEYSNTRYEARPSTRAVKSLDSHSPIDHYQFSCTPVEAAV